MLGVSLRGVSKRFQQYQVLRGINLEVAPKEQCVIRGASGSGKSTLLYIVAGLEKTTAGEVNVGGTSLGSLNDEQLAYYRNQKVGLVFQFHYLLSSMDCLNNILLPARICGKSGGELKIVHDRVHNLGRHLGVVDCFHRYPYQLSGGEQQRINIIRALSLNPGLLLCDEPTGNLDSANSQKVTDLLSDLSRELSSTLIVVTHNEKMAACFQRQIVMSDGILLE